MFHLPPTLVSTKGTINKHKINTAVKVGENPPNGFPDRMTKKDGIPKSPVTNTSNILTRKI